MCRIVFILFNTFVFLIFYLLFSYGSYRFYLSYHLIYPSSLICLISLANLLYI